VTTWYEVLDVAPEADAAVIKRAKHAKALLTHPDKAKGAVGAHEAAQRVNLVRIRRHRMHPCGDLNLCLQSSQKLAYSKRAADS